MQRPGLVTARIDIRAAHPRDPAAISPTTHTARYPDATSHEEDRGGGPVRARTRASKVSAEPKAATSGPASLKAAAIRARRTPSRPSVVFSPASSSAQRSRASRTIPAPRLAGGNQANAEPVPANASR